MNGLSWVKGQLEGLGQLSLLASEAVVSLFCRPFDVRQAIYQTYFIGAKSQSVVLITGAFTGMVLAAQTYFQFHKVRMDTATMAVVSVSMCSELGPVLTGLMVAGRVGVAVASLLFNAVGDPTPDRGCLARPRSTAAAGARRLSASERQP